MVSESVSHMCIIGAGAGGLSILKVLLESEECKAGFWDLTVFEAREGIGGVWFPSSPEGDPPASPMYDALTTNLPHPVMAFQSHWFPPSTPLFPHASAVLTYLNAYAERFGLLKFIRFNVRVEEALWVNGSWKVRLSTGITQWFNKIVVANGHYTVPRYPDFPGLQSWIDSGKASHSVSYRNATPYRGKRVLVIGGGPSGQDISMDVSDVATVYHSVIGAPSGDMGNYRKRGQVLQLNDDGTVVFEDESTSNIDHVINATGYRMSFPFLPQLRLERMPQIPPLPSYVLNSTYNVFPLARHIFPLQDIFPIECIAFAGLLIRVAPFPLLEAQGRFISRVFSKPGYFDRANENDLIVARFKELQGRWGDRANIVAQNWHRFEPLEQFSYRRELLELAGAGEKWIPEDWVEEIYCARYQLRAAWVELEKNGQADEWVRGVGEGGRHEWVSLMRRLLSKDATN